MLKKCKKPDGVLFINAAVHFVKGKRQNQLKKEHIQKIIYTCQHRKEEPRYSRRVDMAEIEKSDFNLNIFRYISMVVSGAEIDLRAVNKELIQIERKIGKAAETQRIAQGTGLATPFLAQAELLCGEWAG